MTLAERYSGKSTPDPGVDLTMGKEVKNGKMVDHNGTAANDSLGRRRSGRF